MDKKKVLVLTDMDFRGSGYYYLMSGILEKLSEFYDIKVVGLGYRGEEHNYGFSIIPLPSDNVVEAISMASVVIKMWNPDVFICGADIPIQMMAFKELSQLKKKYIAITPLENPPLTQSWAARLMLLDWVFFISKIGEKAARDAGLSKVGHIDYTIDKTIFRPAVVGEREDIRKDCGYQDDEFVILTVADNQERKNLWASLSIVSKLKKLGKKIKYVLVTREHTPDGAGYNIRDLCMNLDINKETLILERGITREHLRSLYISSDLFLLTSKAEGLGIPVLESMACGLPVAATDTGAIHELLEDGRGFLLPVEYFFTDVWGNETRSMVDIDKSTEIIANEVMDINLTCTTKAQQFIAGKDITISVDALHNKIEELTNEK